MARTERIVFEEVSIRAQKSYRCACGRRCRRSKKFFQTINPWNKRKDGLPKTVSDIHHEIVVEADAWRKEPDTCNHGESDG